MHQQQNQNQHNKNKYNNIYNSSRKITTTATSKTATASTTEIKDPFCSTCHGGKWSCQDKKPCVSVCSAWGNSHYETFDGSEFDFHGSCEYVLAAAGEADQDKSFVVTVKVSNAISKVALIKLMCFRFQNIPCATSDVVCSKKVSLKLGGGDGEAEKVTFAKKMWEHGHSNKFKR